MGAATRDGAAAGDGRVDGMSSQLLRNRFFVEGIVLGGICGVVLGTLIAFQVGNERVAPRRLLARLERVVGREPAVPFELFRQ
jgi:hypothetical protein